MKYFTLVLGLLLAQTAYSDAHFSIQQFGGVVEISLDQFDSSTLTSSLNVYRQGDEIVFALDDGFWIGQELFDILFTDPLDQNLLILNAQNVQTLGNSMTLEINDSFGNGILVDLGAVTLPNFPNPGLFSTTTTGPLSFSDFFTSSNSDMLLIASGDVSINGELNTGSGNLLISTNANCTQSSPIFGNRLGLSVQGTTDLTNAGNDFNYIASDWGELFYLDSDDIEVASIVAGGYFISGIYSFSSDVALTAGGDIHFDSPVSIGSGSLFLTASGNVTQAASIGGTNLGLIVNGETTLDNSANNFFNIACDVSGQFFYSDLDYLEVEDVSVNGTLVSGIATSNDDVKISCTNYLYILESISLGSGNLLLEIDGDIYQSAPISGEGLALLATGTIFLADSAANDFNVLASQSSGELMYDDINDITIGTVEVDGAIFSGILYAGDVSLITVGDVIVDESIILTGANLSLVALGHVSQSASITCDGLGLVVSGNTILENSGNDFNIIAADCYGDIRISDANSISVGSLFVYDVDIAGLTTNYVGDVKISTGGDLEFLETVDVGTERLLVVADGNVTQTTSLTGGWLGLIVQGSTTLTNAANDFAKIAVYQLGDFSYIDSNDLSIASVLVDGTSVVGLQCLGSNAAITSLGDLTITEQVGSDGANNTIYLQSYTEVEILPEVEINQGETISINVLE